MQKNPPSAFPLHALYNIEKLGTAPAVFPIRPDAAKCQQLAEYLGVQAVEKFHAELILKRWRGRGVRVEGTVSATIVQNCAVSLEPVRSQVKEEVLARFLPESLIQRDTENAAEIIIDPLADDPPEAFDGREIDLGALAVEFLVLGIDPYIRAPGVALPEQIIPADGIIPDAERKNPFQVLQGLKDKKDA